MIEVAIREIFPKFDVTPVLNVRLRKDPEILEAILSEYGLTDLLAYAVDPSILNEQAFSFLRIRGTLRSIRMAMGWVGFPNITFKPLSWFEYEVDPGRIPTAREIEAIKSALTVSVQARGVLKRIHHNNFEVKP